MDLVRYRNLTMILVGIFCLLIKSWFAGSIDNLAYSYLGNLSASFAVYFIVSMLPIRNLTWPLNALLALLIVESFELTNGFGIMTNVYDPWDYLANFIGIGLAIGIDYVSRRIINIKYGNS